MASESVQYDLKNLVETDMYEPLDKAILNDALSKDPFFTIPGLINIRDIGAAASPYLRRGLIYRSGALNNLSAPSQAKLQKELGIKLILDLRTPGEVAKMPDPTIDGVKNVNMASLKAPTPIDLNDFLVDAGKTAYVKMYEDVLDIHKPSITAALEWVRDEGSPMLFHCTSGKDRTGVLAAILLDLAGAPKNIIAYDYALSRVGVEPARELLTQMLKMWNKDWTLETPGMKEFSQIKAEFMLGTLEMMEERYGGVEGYVRGLGFVDNDLVKIRKVLRGE